MKILFAHFGIFEKGGWGRTFPIAEGLAKLGCNVTIVTTNPHLSFFIKRKIINNVIVLIFPDIVPQKITSKGFGFISLFLKIIYIVFKKFDIVQSDEGHRPQSGIICRIHKKIHKSKYVAEWWDWFGKGGMYERKSKLFKTVLGRYEIKYEIKDKLFADGVVVLSDLLMQRALSLNIKGKIIKLHGGADVHKIPFLENNNFLKGKYGIDKNRVTFGYIDAMGHDIEEIKLLVDVVLKFKIESKVKILLFGGAKFFEENLSKEIKEILINYGWINYSTDFEKLQCVDVFVLFKENSVANRAGWPNCLGDYLACGRPILLNPVGEVIEFVNKYPKGFFVSTLSIESISKHVNFIIDHKSNLITKGRINREIAEQEISWDKKSKILYDFYKDLLLKE